MKDKKKSSGFKSGKEWKGNVKGRPKGSKGLKTLFNQAIETIIEKGIDDPEVSIISSLLTKAQNGSPAHMKMYLEYRHGKPTQEIKFEDVTSIEKEAKVLELRKRFREMGDEWDINEDEVTYIED